MTQKLYLDHSYDTVFEANVESTRPAQPGVSAIVLDRTLFYPESGGQLSDRGTLGGVDVIDVQENGDVVEHLVKGEVSTVAPLRGARGRDHGAHRDGARFRRDPVLRHAREIDGRTGHDQGVKDGEGAELPSYSFQSRRAGLRGLPRQTRGVAGAFAAPDHGAAGCERQSGAAGGRHPRG